MLLLLKRLASVECREPYYAKKGQIVKNIYCYFLMFNLCGHGHFDMQAYRDYMDGKLIDLSHDQPAPLYKAERDDARTA